MPILFYSHTKGPHTAFSNFSPHGFELDGALWPTVEHNFQAAKSPGTPRSDAIRLAKTQYQEKQLGASREGPIREDWEDVTRRAVQCTMETHRDVRDLVVSTGDEELIEDTKDDYHWGRGANGTGKNRLGAILMEVRAALLETS